MNAVKTARAKLAEAQKAWAETPEWAKRAAKSWSEPLMDALSELENELVKIDRGFDAMQNAVDAFQLQEKKHPLAGIAESMRLHANEVPNDGN